MSQSFVSEQPHAEDLGLNLKPGDDHYRAYVGPPQDYDLVSAMVFNLLTSIGLRQHHRVLDIGCGSLRVGRLLIPYLNAGHYVGVEPNQWLVEAGVANEIGADLVRIKRPQFSYRDSLEEFSQPLKLDFAVAQSIFSHTGLDLLERWLVELGTHLKDDGALLATFLPDSQDFSGQGWVYPGCVRFRPETLAAVAARQGMDFRVLDWAHPRQTWALFSRQRHDRSLVDGGAISWNRFVAQTMRG